MADGQRYSAGNLDFVIQAVGKESNNSLDKMNKNLKASAFSLTKLVNQVYFLRNYTKQMFRSLTGIVQKAVDYTETLNLWQVAMRGNTQEAEDFVMTMNKAYGIATKTLMEYQAIFKNMLSSLGGINDNVSYQLSEYLTQMAIDYASLYNTSIERAMTTFQSVLSGQVRPIRSIAGYDITETTIYQLYQQLGGTKTMRQLSQTEKRLLRIYAVFQQMESSGAIGDLGKTMGSTANQMRMFSEATKEFGTWLGIIVEHYLAPFLPKLNAFVITLTNITKAIAKMNNIKPQEFGIVESVQQLNEELDQTQGKLLSFDRFEALNSGAGDNNLLGIDENLLAGLSKYESILSRVTGEAQELAEQWTSWWVDADTGELTKQAQDLLDVLESIGIVIGILVGYKLITKVGSLLGKITGLTSATKILNAVIITGTIFVFKEAIDLFNEGNYVASALATTVGVLLVANFIRLNKEMLKTTGIKIVTFFKDFIKWSKSGADQLAIFNARLKGTKGGWNTMTNGAKLASVALGALLAVTIYSGLDSWFSTMNNQTKIIIGTITALIAVITGATVAWMAFHGAMSMGVAVPVILGAVGAGVAGIKAIIDGATQYKTGGLVEDGLFQMSKGEIIGNFDDGSTVVANNQQIISGIQSGVYSAVVSAMKQSGNNKGGNVYLYGKKVGQLIAQPSHTEMVRTGLVKVSS